jgi:hypothetical protein
MFCVKYETRYFANDFTLNTFICRPTYEDLTSWGSSFDSLMTHKGKQHRSTNTLAYFLIISVGQKFFAEFLKSEFSDENILFWQACEELKREKNPEKIEEKARIIYEDFISILSPKEVHKSKLLLTPALAFCTSHKKAFVRHNMTIMHLPASYRRLS